MFILDLTAMKVLLLLFPFVLAAFAERAQVFLFLTLFAYIFQMTWATMYFPPKSPTFSAFLINVQVKYLGGITFLLRDRCDSLRIDNTITNNRISKDDDDDDDNDDDQVS